MRCPKARVPVKDNPLAKSRSRRLIFIPFPACTTLRSEPLTVAAYYYEGLRSVNESLRRKLGARNNWVVSKIKSQ